MNNPDSNLVVQNLKSGPGSGKLRKFDVINYIDGLVKKLENLSLKFPIQRKKLKRSILPMMIYMLTKRSVKLNVRLNLKRSEKS